MFKLRVASSIESTIMLTVRSDSVITHAAFEHTVSSQCAVLTEVEKLAFIIEKIDHWECRPARAAPERRDHQEIAMVPKTRLRPYQKFFTTVCLMLVTNRRAAVSSAPRQRAQSYWRRQGRVNCAQDNIEMMMAVTDAHHKIPRSQATSP